MYFIFLSKKIVLKNHSFQITGVYLFDPSMREAEVVGFEEKDGHVKVVTKMTFDDWNEDPGATLTESIQDGTLGELSVDPESISVKELNGTYINDVYLCSC